MSDDILNGGVQDEYLVGNSGDNTLLGDAGNDTLLGGNGNDTLLGSYGNDYLNGGNHDDTLTGGEGADTFAFDVLLGGTDTITDFNGTEGDMIEIDMSVYVFDSIDDLSYDSSTGELVLDSDGSAWDLTLAILENPTGFELSSDYISLV